MPSGFALSASLPQGTYDLRVSMLSTVAGTFNLNATTRITIAAPASIPRMSVDLPIQNQFVTTNFSISGWAVDQGSTADTGVDGIHVWAYPVAGGSPIFVGAASLGVSRPDVAAYLGSARFGPSGYFLQGTLPRGQYYLVVFAHSNLALSFNQAAVVTITVV
jgi:hypothetical protein